MKHIQNKSIINRKQGAKRVNQKVNKNAFKNQETLFQVAILIIFKLSKLNILFNLCKQFDETNKYFIKIV